jgi:hypothetical protein
MPQTDFIHCLVGLSNNDLPDIIGFLNNDTPAKLDVEWFHA